VRKIRGSAYRSGYHDFVIETGGVRVFPRLVAAEYRGSPTANTIPSGVEGLDALLGGGLTAGTSTLLVGPAGAGKSVIATQFVVTAASRGKKSAIFLFEEAEHTFLSRTQGLGLDIRGAVVDLFTAGGFEWKGEVVIPKNPQAIAQRQKLHSLLFVTGMRNGRDLAPAVNDYVMIFQKPGEAAPVCCLYDRDENPGGWVTREEWIRDAHGLWTDIRETEVLDGWHGAREEGDEKHVCPLQLEVIRRLVKLYSNPGELILDPFMGIGSTGYVALQEGRSAVGFELKESYHRIAERNLRNALGVSTEPIADLFSLCGVAAG
jgi:hypothetical protein